MKRHQHEGVSVREAVQRAGVTRQQIYNVIINGAVSAVKINGRYVISRESLDAYISGRDRKAG
jgi:excisionase family DNA binding protein